MSGNSVGSTVPSLRMDVFQKAEIKPPPISKQQHICKIIDALCSKFEIEQNSANSLQIQKRYFTLRKCYMNICESKYCFCFEYLTIKVLCVSNSPCNFLKTTEILFWSSNWGRQIWMSPIVLFISFGFAKLVETIPFCCFC